MTGYARGGNDLITGDLSRTQNLYGDAGGDIAGRGLGGDDHIIAGGGPNGTTHVYGDAGGNLMNHAEGGNDFLDGSLADFVIMYGDAGENMSGSARGGNDVMLGGTGGSALTGMRVEISPTMLPEEMISSP